MTLGEYLAEAGLTQAQFAALIHTNQAHVSELVAGKVCPKVHTIFMIHATTKGKVTADDWMKQFKPKRKK